MFERIMEELLNEVEELEEEEKEKWGELIGLALPFILEQVEEEELEEEEEEED